jgi:hypothetical protein
MEAEGVAAEFSGFDPLPGIAAGSGEPTDVVGGEEGALLAGEEAGDLGTRIDGAADELQSSEEKKVAPPVGLFAELKIDLCGQIAQYPEAAAQERTGGEVEDAAALNHPAEISDAGIGRKPAQPHHQPVIVRSGADAAVDIDDELRGRKAEKGGIATEPFFHLVAVGVPLAVNVGIDNVDVAGIEGNSPSLENFQVFVGEGFAAGKPEIDQRRVPLAGAEKIEGDFEGVGIVGAVGGG